MPMDPEDLEYMKAAILQADIVNEDDERWEHERTKQKNGPGALRYRVQEEALIPKQADTGDLGDFVTLDQLDVAIEELGAIAREERDRVNAEIADLRAQISQLRADMQSQKSGSVTRLRGNRDVA